MEDYYKGNAVNVDGFDSYENYIKCLNNLDFTSSPGYPHNLYRSTIGEWLGYDGLTFNEMQVNQLWLEVQSLFEDIDCYWRVFIKQEPHKQEKIEEGRLRLIICAPLHVQVLWQMMFSEMNSNEIANAYNIPSQQGIILCYGGWKHYLDQWAKNGTTCGADKRAWDWTVPGWMLKLDLEFRTRMIRGSDRSKRLWTHASAKLYEDSFKTTKLLFSDGQVYQQQNWGIMKSGCVNTISTNSHCQVFLHILYCLDTGTAIEPMVRALGDDTLQHEKHLVDLSVYEKYGVKIKSVSTTIEFAGNEFKQVGPQPMYLYKHLYNLYYIEDDVLEETLDSYQRLYCHCDEGWDILEVLITSLGLGHLYPSRRYYQRWYDHPKEYTRK